VVYRRSRPSASGLDPKAVHRFQYYHPEEGEILRYNDAHDDEALSWHHRHVSFGEDTEISFQNITVHIARFLREIASLTNTDTDTS
jgi:hypothetical protein